ncbi:helix-turn-helix domain-containing protein [Pelagibacterium montanilacus]|uniref:helix-turn-helix domain-containing protein n=1 Tax=Pelagibacterium montanilacus TaxID=2185280 RepID=UPI0013DFDDBA|nr:XRE family transcriptional regulator [Pelagibacterium montanilacus]
MRAPIGIRISSRRKALGLSQAGLARSVDISPSYLNLIEADKRQVGGTLLQRIAAGLDIDIGELTGEAEHRLIHELVEAFADPLLADRRLGMDEARALVATQPHIAQIVARLHRAYGAAAQSADIYADRLRADPLLSALLHQILSAITAVRSSAEILEDIDESDTDARTRFLSSIGRESRTVASVAHNLIGQFDQASTAGRSISARRELDDMIFAARNHFAPLEEIGARLGETLRGAGELTEAGIEAELSRAHKVTVARAAPASGGNEFGYDASTRTLWFRNSVLRSTRQFQLARLLASLTSADRIQALVAASPLTTPGARRDAARYLASYIAGAILFPYDRFRADAEKLRYDVDALSELYTASFEQIAHRLVTLRRENDEGVPFGFLRADPSGRLTKHFPLPGLLLPQTGHACPLWAIYSAFRTPGQIVRQPVRFPDGSRFLFVAKAVTRRTSGFADQVLPHSILLVMDMLHADRTVYSDGLDLGSPRADIPVGPTCRLCTREDCSSRQEAPFSPDGTGQ